MPVAYTHAHGDGIPSLRTDRCAICAFPADKFVLMVGVRLCAKHAQEVEDESEYLERKTPPPKRG